MPTDRPIESGGRRHLPALLASIVFVLPLWIMVAGSLREPGAPPRGAELIPSSPSLASYPAAFDLVDIPRYMLNSLIVVVVAVPLTVLVASWAGFAISRLGGRAAGVLVGASLVALMIPATALLVPRFTMFRVLGLTDTFVPLWAPALLGTSPLYVLIFAWSFRRLPGDLFDAARLEGLTPFAIWRRVAMPLVRPVTVAVGVLAFVFTWGNFLDPLIYLFDEAKFTVPLGLRALSTLGPQDAPLFLAGAVAASAPVVIAFLYAQRFFLHEHREAGWLGR
ncbi:MAG TPA: carbohydrate ABC transporter permease [Actinomycetota bacterium]